MRCLAALVVITAAVVVTLALNMIQLLSNLDGAQIEIAPLVHGDLSGLLGHASVWTWPSCPHVSNLLAFGPAAVMSTLGAFLLAAARRWPQVAPTWFALLALGSGVVPYAVGAFALRNNTVEPDTGPWLLWMLLGPIYAAVLAMLFLLRGPVANWRQRGCARQTDAVVAH